MGKFAFALLSETVYVNLQVTQASLLLTQASSVDMIGLPSMIPPPHWHCHHRGPTCLQWSVLHDFWLDSRAKPTTCSPGFQLLLVSSFLDKKCRELSGRGCTSASSFCSKLAIWVDTWLLLS